MSSSRPRPVARDRQRRRRRLRDGGRRAAVRARPRGDRRLRAAPRVDLRAFPLRLAFVAGAQRDAALPPRRRHRLCHRTDLRARAGDECEGVAEDAGESPPPATQLAASHQGVALSQPGGLLGSCGRGSDFRCKASRRCRARRRRSPAPRWPCASASSRCAAGWCIASAARCAPRRWRPTTRRGVLLAALAVDGIGCRARRFRSAVFDPARHRVAYA